jgi:hypothetical protein
MQNGSDRMTKDNLQQNSPEKTKHHQEGTVTDRVMKEQLEEETKTAATSATVLQKEKKEKGGKQ